MKSRNLEIVDINDQAFVDCQQTIIKEIILPVKQRLLIILSLHLSVKYCFCIMSVVGALYAEFGGPGHCSDQANNKRRKSKDGPRGPQSLVSFFLLY